MVERSSQEDAIGVPEKSPRSLRGGYLGIECAVFSCNPNAGCEIWRDPSATSSWLKMISNHPREAQCAYLGLCSSAPLGLNVETPYNGIASRIQHFQKAVHVASQVRNLFPHRAGVELDPFGRLGRAGRFGVGFRRGKGGSLRSFGRAIAQFLF